MKKTSNMSIQDILKRSWYITSQNHSLQIYGTLSALFSILIGIPRLHYILRTDKIGWEKIYELIKEVAGSPTIAGTAVISAFIFLYTCSFLIHVLSEAAIIAAVAKSETSGESVSRNTAFGLGAHSFLRFVEFKAFTSLFSVSSLIIWILLFDYYSAFYLDGTSVVRKFLPLTALIAFIILLLDIAFTYAPYHFITRHSTVVAALKRSVKLVIFYLSETMLLTMLLLLIFVRTLVNVILVFFLPMIMVGITTFFAAKISPFAALTMIVLTGIVAIWYAAKISGVLIVFTNAVWTLTYLALDKRKDHVIIHDQENISDNSNSSSDEKNPESKQGSADKGNAEKGNNSEIDVDIKVLPGSGPSSDSVLHPDKNSNAYQNPAADPLKL